MKAYKLFFVFLFVSSLVLSFSSCRDDDDDDLPEPAPQDLTITIQDQYTTQPAKVSIFFKVDKKDGTPLAGLTDHDFNIYEKGRNDTEANLVSVDEADRQISPNSQVFAYNTILVLDLSGSVTNDDLDELKEASKSFVEQVLPLETNEGLEMSIYWFDGEDELHMLQPFTDEKNLLTDAIDGITDNMSNDNSTDLYGAIIKSTTIAETILAAYSQINIVSAASVVIFTDGTDQAARYTKESALAAVNSASEQISYYTIGLGSEIDENILEQLGKNSSAFAENIDELLDTFNQIASLIDDEANSYYLFEYCSPKRDGSGESELTIEAVYEDLKGSATTTFDATGFTGGCQL